MSNYSLYSVPLVWVIGIVPHWYVHRDLASPDSSLPPAPFSLIPSRLIPFRSPSHFIGTPSASPRRRATATASPASGTPPRVTLSPVVGRWRSKRLYVLPPFPLSFSSCSGSSCSFCSRMLYKTVGRYLRAEAASQNGMDNVALYAAAIAVGNLVGLEASTMNGVAGIYVVSRIVYNVRFSLVYC